ncbi:MAG: desulfoferrodoxin [Clostridia bacterium]|nr:desulfoferrodoxin [Clostridia bacterium]
MKFYICETCGNIIEKVKDAKVPVMCCGKKMQEIIPGSVDASQEKHVPVYTVEGNVITVNVGSVDHPMADEHYIEWVAVETKQGVQRKHLNPGSAPNVRFALAEGDEVVSVLAYCNLHGLWKA